MDLSHPHRDFVWSQLNVVKLSLIGRPAKFYSLTINQGNSMVIEFHCICAKLGWYLIPDRHLMCIFQNINIKECLVTQICDDAVSTLFDDWMKSCPRFLHFHLFSRPHVGQVKETVFSAVKYLNDIKYKNSK